MYRTLEVHDPLLSESLIGLFINRYEFGLPI